LSFSYTNHTALSSVALVLTATCHSFIFLAQRGGSDPSRNVKYCWHVYVYCQ